MNQAPVRQSKAHAAKKQNARPLLVVDGDSFAHRAYHALPKSIRRSGGRGGGAILGFANFLLRLYEAEQPRAVLVAWDSLSTPTYRQRLFPAYQGGRHFDEELVDQLETLPDFIAACGFANAKGPGYEADDFLAGAVAAEERRSGTALVASVSSRSAAIHPTSFLEHAAWDQREQRLCCANSRRWRRPWRLAGWRRKPISCASISVSPQWIPRHLFPT
jgi:5'-3' exonuclease, N-terminal resolvase-like domain